MTQDLAEVNASAAGWNPYPKSPPYGYAWRLGKQAKFFTGQVGLVSSPPETVGYISVAIIFLLKGFIYINTTFLICTND